MFVHHLMMSRAEGNEVIQHVLSTLRVWFDVVDLDELSFLAVFELTLASVS